MQRRASGRPAVNYHFQDKEQLYTAVLERAVAAAGEELAQIVPQEALGPEEKLRHFILATAQQSVGGRSARPPVAADRP